MRICSMDYPPSENAPRFAGSVYPRERHKNDNLPFIPAAQVQRKIGTEGTRLCASFLSLISPLRLRI